MKNRSRRIALIVLTSFFLSFKILALETRSCLSPYLTKDLPVTGELNHEGAFNYSKIPSHENPKIGVYTQIQTWNQSDRIAHLWRRKNLKTDYVKKPIEIGKKFYSEKTLSSLSEGTWTVEVRDQEGRILNTLEFSVVKDKGQTFIFPKDKNIVDCLFLKQEQSSSNSEAIPLVDNEAKNQTSEFNPQFAWSKFRIESLAVFKGNKSSTNTAMLSWRPEYRYSEKLSIGIDLGYSIYKRSNGTRFNVYEYALSGTYHIQGPWSAELMAGAQTWMVNDNASKLMLGANGKYTLNQKLFKIIDHVTAGYSSVFQEKTYNILRLGAGIQF